MIPNIQRNYKDRLFCALFGSEERKELTLELYNALNGTHYTNAEDIQINTIKDVLYFGMRNDVSFLLANQISLYEQQSSENPNMPLRSFCYSAHVFEGYLRDTGKDKLLYGKKLVKIPTPKLVVLYNVPEGDGGAPIQDGEMRLSDCFETPGGDIEVIVHVYNINNGNFLPGICTPLRDYSTFVETYREAAKHAETNEERVAAANMAVESLPEGEVKSYILAQKSEVIDMLLTEYNEKEVMDSLRKEAREEGLAEGLEQGLAKGMEKGLAEGKQNTIVELVRNGALSLELGAQQLDISTPQMEKIAFG